MDKKLFSAAMRRKMYGEEFFSPKQKELFPGLRRELTLEIQDAAKSDDPFDACMERKGYPQAKIREFQRIIAEKLTPDMFGKAQKITGAEAMFQDKADECIGKSKPKTRELWQLTPDEAVIESLAKNQEYQNEKKAYEKGASDKQNYDVTYDAAVKKALKQHETAVVLAAAAGKSVDKKLLDHYNVYGEQGKTLFGVEDVQPYFYDDTNEIYWIDPIAEYDKRTKKHYHRIYTRKTSGKLVKSNTLITDDKFSDKFLPAIKREPPKMPGEQLRLFGVGAIDIMAGPWMQDRPFSKEQLQDFNRYNWSDYDINKWFYDEIKPIENDVIEKFKAFNIDPPDNVRIALAWFRKRAYDWYLTRAKSNNYAPSPAVVGPSNYGNYHTKLDKAMKWENKATEEKEQSLKRLEREISGSLPKRNYETFGVSKSDFENLLAPAISMKKRDFGKFYFDYMLANEKNPNLKSFYEALPDNVRKSGYKLQEQLLRFAASEGLDIAEAIKKEHPKVFAPAEYKEMLENKAEKRKEDYNKMASLIDSIYEKRRERQEEIEFMSKHSPTQLVLPGTKQPEQLRLFGRIRRSLQYAL